MTMLLIKGSTGAEVGRLAEALRRELGDDADDFPTLAGSDTIDADFDAAIRRWQAGVGLIADGVVGPLCQVLLEMMEPQGGKFGSTPLTVAAVSRLFPATKPANIARYLPYIEAALGVCGLTDRPMVLGALGTIRSESEGFVPITEFPSKFNSDPGAAPFNRYDGCLGNDVPGDGFRYRGRGFVQLTGKFNYRKYAAKLDFPLDTLPDLANAPEIAALLLATFLADVSGKFRTACNAGDLAAARKLVNGGSHGLDRFCSVYTLAESAWSTSTHGVGAGKSPTFSSLRTSLTSAKTKKDTDDLRDRVYQPGAISLPNEFPSSGDVQKYLARYTQVGLILDQGREGACTGFGLSCVINYLRWIKAEHPDRDFISVSPRMLYTLARRYDEYEGENYEGSSCRGAIKAWFSHGVCLENDWPYSPEKSNPPHYGYAKRAANTTLGVYYRVETRSITDMQAALQQHGAVFVSAFTHDGWLDVPDVGSCPTGHKDLPARGDLAGAWTDASDALIEKTFARPLARPIWSEMKENAELAFAPRRGGELLLDALASLAETWGDQFELHLVGHSAGSIILGHLLSALRQRGALADRIASIHLYAPACTVAFANRHYASDSRFMNRLFLDVLSDEVERADTVSALYRKSLLYLVSNALEADLRTPILGLSNIWNPDYSGWDGSSDTAEALAAWRKAFDDAEGKMLDQVDTPKVRVGTEATGEAVQQKAAHGSFDNDVAVITRTLERITGGALSMPVDELRGF